MYFSNSSISLLNLYSFTSNHYDVEFDFGLHKENEVLQELGSLNRIKSH